MEIKIQIRGRIFSLCFGYKTKWFQQAPFVLLCEEWYGEDYQVTFSRVIFGV